MDEVPIGGRARTVTEVAAPALTVRVESFEGPLDLLLHLCRRQRDRPRPPAHAHGDGPVPRPPRGRTVPRPRHRGRVHGHGRHPHLPQVQAAAAEYQARPDDDVDQEGELLRRSWPRACRNTPRVKALGAWLGGPGGGAVAIFGRTTAELPPPEDVPLQDLSVHLLLRAVNRLSTISGRAAALGGAGPHLGRRAHGRDRLPAALDVVAPVLVGGGGRAHARRVGGDAARASRARAPRAGARAAGRAVRGDRHRARRGQRQAPAGGASMPEPDRHSRSAAVRLRRAGRSSSGSATCSICSSVGQAQELVAILRERLVRDGRALQVVEVAGGVRLVTRSEVAPWLVRLARSRTRSRMSRPALEALAIVAYRQPVSKPEIDAVRGVNSEGVLDSLLERRLVRIAGRKETAGRPFLYETTREFLIAFGLRDLGDLPKPEGDLVIPADVPAPGGAEPRRRRNGRRGIWRGQRPRRGARRAAAAREASHPGAPADAEPGDDGTGGDVRSGEPEREDVPADLPVAAPTPGERSAGAASAPRPAAEGVAVAEGVVPPPAMAEAPSRPPAPGDMPPAPSDGPGSHPRAGPALAGRFHRRIRLSKILAQAGLASRRGAEALLARRPRDRQRPSARGAGRPGRSRSRRHHGRRPPARGGGGAHLSAPQQAARLRDQPR